MKKQGFIVLPSYYEAVMMIEDEKLRLEAWDTLMSYGMEGVLPDNLNPMVKMLMKALQPTIDNTKRRYEASVENGKKGGAPRGNQNARKKQPKTTQEQPKNNLNKDKDKDKERDIEKERDVNTGTGNTGEIIFTNDNVDKKNVDVGSDTLSDMINNLDLSKPLNQPDSVR